jgi:hypothetical protein
VLRAIGGAVQGTVAWIAGRAIIAAPCDDQIENARRIAYDAPGEGLRAFDSSVL